MNSQKIDLEFKIAHRNWLESSNELFALMNTVLPGEVIVVVGPSRAGKSRLIEYMCSLVSREEEHDEKGIMPCVVVEVANCGQNGTFSTKNLAVRMLEKLKHPLFGIADDLTQETKRLQLISRTPGASLQLSAEIALRARGTRFLFLDEAQHVSYAQNSERAASAIMNSWKCLARSANVVLIIVGAYPILSLLHDSPHMLGRKHQVHLRRYNSTSAEDVNNFASIVRAYGDRLNCPELLNNLGVLFAGSLGCIGLLRAWLLRSAVVANARGIALSIETVRQQQLPSADLREILREIEHGESLLEIDAVFPSKKTVVPQKKRDGKGGRKPFSRNPCRYSAGNRNGVDA